MTYPAFHANYLARDLPANLCSRCGEPQPFTLRIPAGRYHFGTRVATCAASTWTSSARCGCRT